MSESASRLEQPAAGWRVKLGIVIFGLSIILPVGGLAVVANLGLSTTMTASISGGLLVSAELLGLVAVAVMGKPGYLYIKSRVLVFLKQHGPPKEVSRIRYNIGLVMFSVPLVFGWLYPYIGQWVPGVASHPLSYAVGGDIVLVASLFVLGGDFWDKVRALFVHNKKVNRSQE